MLLNPTVFVPSAVQLDKSPLVGVPSAGVTSVGLVDSTLLPDPVLVVTPVPPLATAKVPATLTAPLVAVLGVSPVEPKLIVVTLAVDAITLTVPAEFLKYSFSSRVLMASSPSARLPEVGAAEAVALR